MKLTPNDSKAITDFRRGTLLVTHVAVSEFNGQGIPTVLFDASKRPDFLDLFRVHDQEPGEGDTECSWGVAASPNPDDFEMVLKISFLKPAKCEVLIRFELRDKHQVWALMTAAETGLLGLSPATPKQIEAAAKNFEPTPSLLIECFPDAGLKEGLRLFRTTSAVQRILWPGAAD